MVLNTNKHTYNKKKRNLSIDKDLIKTVKKYKINIYLFLSDKLNEYITNNNLWTGRSLHSFLEGIFGKSYRISALLDF